MGGNPIGLNYRARLCSGKGNLKRKTERKCKTKTIEHGYPRILLSLQTLRQHSHEKKLKKLYLCPFGSFHRLNLLTENESCSLIFPRRKYPQKNFQKLANFSAPKKRDIRTV
jgi:hypothetical protein